MYILNVMLLKSQHVLYASADAEHLLATKSLKWHDLVLKVAPMPRSRHAVAYPESPSASSSPADRSDDSLRTGDDVSSDNCSMRTDDNEQNFYDAEIDAWWLAACNEEDPSTAAEEEANVLTESPQHTGTGVSCGASARLEPCNEDVDDTNIVEEEIAFEEPLQHSGSGDSPVKSIEINDAISTSLNDTKDLQNVKVITSEISTLPLEKLKFLKKLIKKKKICMQCKVKVDLEYETVTLSGTEDDVMTTKVVIYEALTIAVQCNLNISKELGRLITSIKGQEWFDESCDRCSFVGICYLDSLVTKVLATDEAMADAMRKWLVEALLSERKSFESHQLSFLRTQSWMDFVRKFTDSQLILITVDDSKMEILVEGLTDMVKPAVKEIDDLLNRHCPINKKLTLKPADFRTLSFRSTDIVNEVQDLVVQQQR